MAFAGCVGYALRMTSDIFSLIQTSLGALPLILLGLGAHRRWPATRWPFIIVASAMLFLLTLEVAGYGELHVAMPESLYLALNLASFLLIGIGVFLCARRVFARPAARDIPEPR